MEETEILHISDTHLGKRMYHSDERRRDFMDAFRAAIQLAVNEDVDAVVHTGDLFDDPKPNLKTVIECADILSMLDDAGIPFYAIVGNHERKREEQWVDLVKRSSNSVKRLTTKPTIVGDFALYGIDAIRKNEWSKIDFELEPPENENATRILAMHELVMPIVQENRGADYHISDIMDKLSFVPDGIALGDYHAHEEVWQDNCRVFYPGPTERTKVNENPGTVLLLRTDSSSRDFDVEKRYISNVDDSVPREFAVRTVEIGEKQGIEVVEDQLDNLEAKYDGLSNIAVVIKLTGCYNDVSASDVYELMDDYSVGIQKVMDKRASNSLDVDVDVDELSEDLSSLNSLLEKATKEVDMHESVSEIASVVDDEDEPKNSIRDKSKEILSEGVKSGDKE